MNKEVKVKLNNIIDKEFTKVSQKEKEIIKIILAELFTALNNSNLDEAEEILKEKSHILVKLL